MVSIRADFDIVAARIAARNAARRLGFGTIDQARIATATSDLARSMLVHAGEGSVTISAVEDSTRRGLRIVFEDHGPPIVGPDELVQNGTPAGSSTSYGLSSSERLMDELQVESALNSGTRITCYKWLRSS